MVAVGAVDEQDEIASFSTFGDHVSLSAPGSNILSAFADHAYAISSGTSQAAPFVSGAVALLKSYARERGKKLTDGQVKWLLTHTARRSSRLFKDEKAGFGRLHILDALKLLHHKLHSMT